MAIVEFDVDVQLSAVSKGGSGNAIGRCLFLKGFCVLKPPLEDGRLAAAVADARELSAQGRLGQVPTMMVDGLLGLQGSAKMCDLGLPDGEDPDRLGGAGLHYLDSELTEYGMSVFPYLSSMGIDIQNRTAGVLHEAGLPLDEGPELTAEVCAKWMTIFAHHKMMCIWCVGPDKGMLELQPFDNEANGATIAMSPGTLVILRPDAMQHRFTAAGKAFCLTCFFQKDQRLSKFKLEDRDLTPCCEGLEEWAAEIMREYKESLPEEQARMQLPRSWELMANHTTCVGQHIAIRTAATRQIGSWDPVAWTCGFITGPDYIQEVPLTRWDHSTIYHSDSTSELALWKTNCMHGGFMDGIELFDNKLFRLSNVEAGGMDPGHRLILETGYEALHKDGYKTSKMMNSRGGVYVANPPGMEWTFAERSAGASGVCGGGGSIACGRFSFVHGIKGPCISVDVEGASSLVAVNMAGTNLSRVGNWEPIPFAMCASYNLQLAPRQYAWGAIRGAFSRGGRTFAFDASADGFVRGDVACALVLKTLTDIVDDEAILKDEDFLGALAGMATNQSGRRAFMQAPDSAAFQEVVADCIRQADISPLDVDGCDCYADGSILGDAVEASATAKAYRPEGMHNVLETAPVALFTSKGTVGNQIEACGLSSILKAVLGAQYGLMYPNLHLRILNPHVDIDACERPAFLAGEPMEFSMESCYVGITNRSFSGTNCHAIIWGQITDEHMSTSTPWKQDKITFWPEGGGELAEEQRAAQGYSIIGSWSGWQPEQMAKEGPGLWTFAVTLGINRWERFQILLDGASDRVLHPEYAGAGGGASVCGPDELDSSENWLIDGRSYFAAAPSSPHDEDSALPGEKFSIQLCIKGKYRKVDWVRLPGAERGPVDLGSYAVVGTWSDYSVQDMQPDAGVPGLFSIEVHLIHGPGYFQILRNKDWGQVLYPDKHGSTDPSAESVCGPDESATAAWYIYGKRGDVYKIEFQRSCSDEGVDSKTLSWTFVRNERS